MTTVAVTGSGGFIGAYLVRRLLAEGYEVRCIDNFLRGRPERLAGLDGKAQVIDADVRQKDKLLDAFRGCEVVFHLAAVNGTENFYKHPDLVLDVGVRGAIAVCEAAMEVGVPDLVVASSAEVYQTPAIVPTDESVPLVMPNSLNPRYSYGGSKLISEIITFNYCRDKLRKVQVFRPHNVYGPDMGWKHVIPQLIGKLGTADSKGKRQLVLQGDGSETRAFCFVDDIVEGIVTMWKNGETMNVYHIGTMEEVSIRHLAATICTAYGVDAEVVAGPGAEGGTPRRCPDVRKLMKIGYAPKVSLADGVAKTVAWYKNNPEPAGNALL
jgi:UDP-glucose 4-epimerase